MGEMSQKFLNKLGVDNIDDIINNMEEKHMGRHFMDHITSCNKVSFKNYNRSLYKTIFHKVSNGVLLDEYQHNLDAAMNLPQGSGLGKS